MLKENSRKFAGIFRLSVFILLLLTTVKIHAQQTTLVPTKTETIKIFETPFTVNNYEVVKDGRKSPLTFLVLHNNEQTGLNLVKEKIQKDGGRLIELVSEIDGVKYQRNLFFKYGNEIWCVDPNRIFSASGIEETLKDKNQLMPKKCQNKDQPVKPELKSAIENFAAKLKTVFLPLSVGGILISVHNNTDDGGLTIKSFEPGGSEAATTRKAQRVSGEDVDDFLMTSTVNLYQKLSGVTGRENKFNIAVQKSPPFTKDDGSLSIYCGNQKIDYILVEAEHGKGKGTDMNRGKARQKQMIDFIFALFPPS